MRDFAVTVDIQAPADRVAGVTLDVEHWPDWTSTVISVRRLENGPFAGGSCARVRQPKLMPAVWRVTELDDRRGFTWVTNSPGLQITAGHYLEAQGSPACRVTLSLRFDGLLGFLAGCLYGKLTEQYLATEARGLKACCEGDRQVA
jgi:uncharacterized membrane protein